MNQYSPISADAPQGADDRPVARQHAELVILIPVKQSQAPLFETLKTLVESRTTLRTVDVRVICDGPTDDSGEPIQAFKESFADREWTLFVDEIAESGKVGALRHGMASVPKDSLVMMMDARCRLEEDTLQKLFSAVASGDLDIASTHIRYLVSGDRFVRAFSRAYSQSPYARSSDLKGTCVVFAPCVHHVIENAPNVASDDRYFLSSVPRKRRGRIDGAYSQYHFPATLTGLFQQQRRWVTTNREFDRSHDGYERNDHEARTGPYFGSQPPAIADRIVYFAMLLAARMFPMRLKGSSSWQATSRQ